MLERLDATNLHAVGRGCSLLAAGGGGDPDLALLMALHAVDGHGPVRVVRLADLAADDMVMPCGLIGAPTVATERIWSGEEGRVLRDQVEALYGARVAALMCFGIGGANGLLPVTWAARLGLPVVDADGMGRAFPELQQQSMHLAGIAASPVVVTDGRGNTLVLRAADDAWAERLARGVAGSLGGVCAGALYCMPGAAAQGGAIDGSLSRALELGEAMDRDDGMTGLGGLVEVLISEGTVVDVERSVDGGFVRGSATVRGTGRDATRELRLELQNEFLLAIEDGAVRAAVPDIICVLDSGSGQPLATDRLRYGDRVAVVAASAPAVWRTDAGLALGGPVAFGYEVDYAPLLSFDEVRHEPA